jgi:hypothetical protein
MRRIVTILVLTVLLASCSGARDSADSTMTPPSATTQAAATGEIDGSFDVGGHKLHLRCQGKGSPGSPTVVYLHGLGGDGSDIKSINTPLASQARVCRQISGNGGSRPSGRATGWVLDPAWPVVLGWSPAIDVPWDPSALVVLEADGVGGPLDAAGDRPRQGM